MHTLRMTRRDAWMLEVFVRIMHANALHDGSRLQIEQRCKRDDFRQCELHEGDARGTQRCLSGEPLAPMGAGETPADLDARRKREHTPGN